MKELEQCLIILIIFIKIAILIFPTNFKLRCILGSIDTSIEGVPMCHKLVTSWWLSLTVWCNYENKNTYNYKKAFNKTWKKCNQVQANFLWLASQQADFQNPSLCQNIVGKNYFLSECSRMKNNFHLYPKMSIHTVTAIIHPWPVREKAWMKQRVSHRTVSATLSKAVQSVPARCISTWARRGDVSMPHLLVCSHEKEVVKGGAVRSLS